MLDLIMKRSASQGRLLELSDFGRVSTGTMAAVGAQLCRPEWAAVGTHQLPSSDELIASPMTAVNARSAYAELSALQ